MRNLHNVTFITSHGSTRVFLDDKELKGCFHAEFKWDVKELPVVTLDMMATEITVEIEKAEVNEVKPDDKRT